MQIQSRPDGTTSFWPPTLAALAAMFVGIGLARFAYTPLLPAIISTGWFRPDQAAYLGAANLAGYLAGALAGHRLARATSTRIAARALMLLTAASFLACIKPAPFAWFFLWRFVSGFTGGGLMVIAAPSVLRLVPARRRGLASGLIFTGVGLGIATSGTLTPLLLSSGLSETWLAYGLISAAASVAVWRWWPSDAAIAAAPAEPSTRAPRARWPLQATAVVTAYGLLAAGQVPHMMFLVDFVARGLDAGIHMGSVYWVLFGLGATAGPAVAGLVADRTGFGIALNAGIVLQVAAVACLLVTTGPFALSFSSIVIGAFVPGNVPLVLGRTQELFTDPRERQSAWRTAIVVFAIGQAVSAYCLSGVFAATGCAYRTLFALGALALAGAFLVQLIAVAATRLARQPSKF